MFGYVAYSMPKPCLMTRDASEVVIVQFRNLDLLTNNTKKLAQAFVEGSYPREHICLDNDSNKN